MRAAAAAWRAPLVLAAVLGIASMAVGSRALAQGAHPQGEAPRGEAAREPLREEPATEEAGREESSPSCSEPRQCFELWTAGQQRITRMVAAFRQTKRVALLEAPLVSTGRLEFRAPDAIRWEVVTPEALVVEIDAGSLRAGAPGAVSEVEAGGALPALRDLGALFAADGRRSSTTFSIAAGRRGPQSFLLVPEDPRLRRVVTSVEIDLDPASGIARRVVLREAGGDETEIDLEVQEIVRARPALADAP